ncbi:hypothetical protein VP01_1393g3 [Puccinia sorghi]|uniref:Uncharacterized protein n=1 Tax=Puccinia sorghi TaxID=27349 RepID=A0A0L6VL39_9BASI|nr:hypothetical protein VP01_1393g3 [Puccinia sorghi]
MQHSPAKLPSKLHLFAYPDVLAVTVQQSLDSWRKAGVTTEASHEFLHVNCKQLNNPHLASPLEIMILHMPPFFISPSWNISQSKIPDSILQSDQVLASCFSPIFPIPIVPMCLYHLFPKPLSIKCLVLRGFISCLILPVECGLNPFLVIFMLKVGLQRVISAFERVLQHSDSTWFSNCQIIVIFFSCKTCEYFLQGIVPWQHMTQGIHVDTYHEESHSIKKSLENHSQLGPLLLTLYCQHMHCNLPLQSNFLPHQPLLVLCLGTQVHRACVIQDKRTKQTKEYNDSKHREKNRRKIPQKESGVDQTNLQKKKNEMKRYLLDKESKKQQASQKDEPQKRVRIMSGMGINLSASTPLQVRNQIMESRRLDTEGDASGGMKNTFSVVGNRSGKSKRSIPPVVHRKVNPRGDV